jgi:hypothetical protein
MQRCHIEIHHDPGEDFGTVPSGLARLERPNARKGSAVKVRERLVEAPIYWGDYR